MRIKINKKLVGLRIKNIRTTLFYTLEEFGNLKGIEAGKSNVSTWERGSSIPNITRLGVIAQYGNITINELLYGSIDEFLENNIERLLMNSKYPYTSIFESYELKEACLIYIDNINSINIGKISINDISSIEKAFNSVLESIISEVSEEYSKLRNKIVHNKEVAEKCIKKYTSYFVNFQLAIMMDSQDISTDNKEFKKNKKVTSPFLYLEYLLKLSSSDDIETKLLYFPCLKMLNEFLRREMENHFLTIKTNLVVFQLNKLTTVEVSSEDNLYSYISKSHEIQDTTIVLKENKYDIKGFKGITGIFIENEDTLYYLAHYPCIEDVPLNTEAQYFILNYDNSYFISKITEKPDCKYLAPILGKME